MGISDLIAGFISDVLDTEDGYAEMQRSELAQRFNCVPSQINYVISTRFSPEHGYIVESRRGGSGYIRITRVRTPARQLMSHIIDALGDEADQKTALALLSNVLKAGAIDERTAKLVASAISDNALRPIPPEFRNAARASIMKYMLIGSI